MRTLILHNARSGFGSDAVFQFERALVQAGDICELRVLSEDFTADEACTDAEDFDVVVLSGGDGTVTTLLRALAYRDVTACVFPSGTANLLAAHLGSALEPSSLARACRRGMTATLDLGEITWTDEEGQSRSRGFGIMSGSGFDSQIMQAAIPNKAVMGQAAYFAAALANPRPAVPHFTVTVDGETIERDGITCLMANTAMIQGDIEIVPDCRMDDGLLDVIFVETSDTAQLIAPLTFALMDRSGKALGRPYIESFKGREVHVEMSEPIALEVDGEPMPGLVTSYDVRSLPGAVNVIVDPLSRYAPADGGPSRFGGSDVIAYPK